MTHTSDEISVGGRYTFFTLCKNAHITAEAGSAGRCGNYAAGFDEDLEKTFFKALHINGLGSGKHDCSHTLCNMSALKDLSCDPHIGDTSVGAGTDDNLIDINISVLMDLIDGMSIFGKMRE